MLFFIFYHSMTNKTNNEEENSTWWSSGIIFLLLIMWIIVFLVRPKEKVCNEITYYSHSIPEDIRDSSYFDSRDCVDNCEWHEAGYKRWYDNNVSSCWGNSESFIEWCYIFLEEKDKHENSLMVLWCENDDDQYYENEY